MVGGGILKAARLFLLIRASQKLSGVLSHSHAQANRPLLDRVIDALLQHGSLKGPELRETMGETKKMAVPLFSAPFASAAGVHS